MKSINKIIEDDEDGLKVIGFSEDKDSGNKTSTNNDEQKRR